MKTKFKNPRAKHDFQGRPCSITGVGSYVPEKILTNAQLEKLVDTSDEWITTRKALGDAFLCERVGLVSLKNVGEMETYFLLGRA